jgi:hypothetical protein
VIKPARTLLGQICLARSGFVPPVEDATPQTAKGSITLPDGGIKQIDFSNSVAGLDTGSIEARAVDLVLAKGPIFGFFIHSTSVRVGCAIWTSCPRNKTRPAAHKCSSPSASWRNFCAC